MPAGSDLAAIVVALISVISAFLAGRAARNAAKFNSEAAVASSKTQAETEAYQRARKMDIETIERQDQEIEEIRDNSAKLREKVRMLMIDNDRLREDNQNLHADNDTLRRRITSLELKLGEFHG
jgi:FtsZ-binding cell division protein ZapB